MSEENFPSSRVKILQEAIKLTEGDRQESYGSFQKNMRDLAIMMNAYLYAKYGLGKRLNSADAAFFMVLAKMVRTFQHVDKPVADNYIDGACYFAMAGEAAFYEQD